MYVHVSTHTPSTTQAAACVGPTPDCEPAYYRCTLCLARLVLARLLFVGKRLDTIVNNTAVSNNTGEKQQHWFVQTHT